MERAAKTLLFAASVLAVLATASASTTQLGITEKIQRTLLEGMRLMEEGHHLDAEKTLLKAVAWAGSDEKLLAVLARPLACLYLNLGRYREAEVMARRSLTFSEARSAADKTDVAVDLGYLAVAYYNQGLYAKAEPLFRRALAIDIAVLGPAHPETAKMRANLACLYGMLRQYSEAERLHREALRLFQDTLEPNDPTIAVSLSNIAVLRFAQGAVSDAAPLLQTAVEILETRPPGSRLGEAWANLGVMLRHLGKPAEAEPLFAQALPLLERTVGPEHPRLATFLEEYAQVLRALRRKKEAKQMRQRAKALFEKSNQDNLAARATVDVRALR